MGREQQIINERIRKIKELRKQGINPYPTKFDKKDSCDKCSKSKISANAKTAGRLMTKRDLGKIGFANLQDESGKIQIVFQDKQTPDKVFNFFKKFIDSGDFIGVEGKIFKTKTKQISILVKKITLLTKSILPLPEKYQGLKDKEERYRKRYIDLIMNPEVKEVFEKRGKIIDAIREFMKLKEFFEVDTPILQPIYGGASARPFESKLNALGGMKVYMRISNELYLKRLIAGGFEKIFEFSKDFRNEGIDKTHNPEFTQVETMWAYADYKDNMRFAEEMISFVAKKVCGNTKIKIEGRDIEFKTPWKKIKFLDIIKQKTKIDFSRVKTLEEAKRLAKKLKIDVNRADTLGEIMNYVFEEKVQPALIQPTLIYDYPVEAAGLAKTIKGNERFVSSFEIFINGVELGLSYCEQNDPEALGKYWKFAEEKFKKGDLEAQPTDNDFINALKVGMPPTSGLGVGIDRLVMLLTNQPSIRDVILFPFMKPEKENKKEIEQERKEKFSGEKVIISMEAKKLGLKTAYAILSGVNIKIEDKKLEEKKKEIKKNKFDLNNKKLKLMRETYKKFGVDPKKRIPSSEALIRRLKEGKDIYKINTLVDSYNLSSVIEELPMASYDLQKVDFPIVLREAKGGERIEMIGGDTKKIKKGEVIYADEKDVLCLDFNYRDCEKTKITKKTKDIILFVDGTSEVSDKELLQSLGNTCELIIAFNGGKVVEKKLAK